MTRDKRNEDQHLPWAVYARLSRAASGDVEKVEYQIAMCEQYAEREGIKIDPELILYDNSLSAWKKGVKHPGWNRLMEAAEAGQIRGVLVWALDRFTRRPSDLEKLIDLADTRDLAIRGPRSGVLELTTATGKQQARWMALQAASESDNTSERVKAQLARRVREGQPMGARSYGFARNGRDQLPEEVDVLRECARMLLSGETLTAIGQWMNEHGHLTTRGNLWTGTKIGRTLGNPRYGGWVELHGEIVGRITNTDGSEQDPVFDQDTYDAVKTILNSRRRGRRPDGRFWLSGVMKCAKCDVLMSGRHLYKRNPRTREQRKLRAYQCHRELGGCGNTVYADEAEAKVSEEMIARLRNPRNAKTVAASMRKVSGDRKKKQSELSQVEQLLVDLEVKLVTGETIQRAYDQAKPRLMKRRQSILDDLARLQPEQVAARFDQDVEWLDVEPHERRELINQYRVRIVVLPWTPQRRGRDRVDVTG